MHDSDCDCANMTLGEVDYILGETESNNYVLNTTTLYASFLNDATGYVSARKMSATRDQRVSGSNATSYVAENDNLSVLRQSAILNTESEKCCKLGECQRVTPNSNNR